MAIKSFTYQDIPQGQRRKAASMAINRLREHLSDPTVTMEQGQKMRERLSQLQQWVEGTIAITKDEE